MKEKDYLVKTRTEQTVRNMNFSTKLEVSYGIQWILGRYDLVHSLNDVIQKITKKLNTEYTQHNTVHNQEEFPQP